MKTLITLITSLIMGMAHAGTPVDTFVPIDEVYAPVGFDSNDNSEIVVSGWLPNLCHKAPKTEYTVTGRKINITVTALKYDATNPFCPEMIVPFVKSVSVGVLDKGKYEITVNSQTPYQKKSSIKIDESSSNAVDDFIYANVHYIKQEMGSNTINIEGYNPSDCYELDEVKFVSNGVNTYSVLPIMRKIRDFCPMKLVPFSHEAQVPDTLSGNKILLHVRSMDGNSVNSLFIKSN